MLIRLWLVEELRKIEAWILDLIKVMAQRAQFEIEACMPGTFCNLESSKNSYSTYYRA